MKNLPVHWYEGLFIRPHHFQAAERHWQEYIQLSDRSNHPYNYGLRSVDLNEDAVNNYQFSVGSLLARMRDGALVSFDLGQEPDRIETKEELTKASNMEQNLESSFAGSTEITVNLAIPKLELGRGNVHYSDDQDAKQNEARGNVNYPGDQVDERFAAHAIQLYEESRGGDVQEIELRSFNARLLVTPGQDSAGYELLPIARIKRAGEETSLPSIDADYIPPILAIDAWPRLARELEGLYHFLGQNIETLSRQVISRGITLASQEPGDLERVFKLRMLNEASACLRCICFATGVHPYEGYRELCRFVGMLSIFGEDRRVPDCPIYDHDDLGTIYPWVINRIKELVSAGGKWEYEMRYFEGAGRGMQVALERKWLNPDWDWYVGVDPGNISEADCHTLLSPGNLDWKIGSSAQVEILYRERRPGLQLVPLRQAPRALPAGRSWIYYEVTRGGPAWTSVQTDNTLAMRFKETLISNLESLQGQRKVVVSSRGRQSILQFALFAVPKS
jgi:type VI secretion system protein ImpJ